MVIYCGNMRCIYCVAVNLFGILLFLFLSFCLSLYLSFIWFLSLWLDSNQAVQFSRLSIFWLFFFSYLNRKKKSFNLSSTHSTCFFGHGALFILFHIPLLIWYSHFFVSCCDTFFSSLLQLLFSLLLLSWRKKKFRFCCVMICDARIPISMYANLSWKLLLLS